MDIVVRFRRKEDSPAIVEIYYHLNQMANNYRRVIGGRMISIGLQILLGESVTEISELNLPTFIPPNDMKPLSPNARYTVQINRAIYERFCLQFVNAEDRNQHSFYLRAALLLGYHYLNGYDQLEGSRHPTSNNITQDKISTPRASAQFQDAANSPSSTPITMATNATLKTLCSLGG